MKAAARLAERLGLEMTPQRFYFDDRGHRLGFVLHRGNPKNAVIRIEPAYKKTYNVVDLRANGLTRNLKPNEFDQVPR